MPLPYDMDQEEKAGSVNPNRCQQCDEWYGSHELFTCESCGRRVCENCLISHPGPLAATVCIECWHEEEDA